MGCRRVQLPWLEQCTATGAPGDRMGGRNMNSRILACGPGLAVLGTLLVFSSAGAAPPTGQFLGGTETTYPDWFKSSFLEFADDVEEAAADGKRVVIFFHQDDCPYCNALVTRNLSQKQIEAKLRSGFDVVALNLRGNRQVVTVDGETFAEKDFARALNIQFTPTLIFLDESGQPVLRLNGYVPPAEFEAALDYVGGRLENQSGYQEYLANRLPTDSAGALSEAGFFAPPPHDLEAARSSGKPLAVFFEQRQCPNCASLHAEALADPGTRELIDSFHAIQLDMWSPDQVITPSGKATNARDWARDLNVTYAPTIILFSSEGSEVIRSEAWLRTFHTQSVFDYVASDAYRDEPDFQRFLTERANRIRATGTDVDIWQ